MIEITKDLWIGSSDDGVNADLRKPGITALLNVAHDLQGKRGHSDGVVYAQCGLIDGPGNNAAAYHAATLMLTSLIQSGKRTLVYDHLGSRALAVSLFYLTLTNRRGWDEWLAIIRERHDNVKEPHAEHKKAFNRLNWKLISSVLES